MVGVRVGIRRVHSAWDSLKERKSASSPLSPAPAIDISDSYMASDVRDGGGRETKGRRERALPTLGGSLYSM